MNILVIGNGFDLEHGLPTKYKDFLDFMQGINLLRENANVITKEYFSDEIEKKVNHKVDKNVKKYFCDKHILNSSVFNKWSKDNNAEELIKCANNNVWINYFIKNINYKKEGWIDLESEISNVIQIVDFARKYTINNKMSVKNEIEINKYQNEILKKMHEPINVLVEKGIIEQDKLITYALNDSMRPLINILIKDLNNLIRGLEIYLEEFVNKIDVNFIAPDIKENHCDKVLSFNYTDTHHRLYDIYPTNPKEYDYIHGKSDINRNLNENNMVLGIDEYLDNEAKNKELEFISFKKYFQRIYKKTGNEYKKWIKEIEEAYKEKIDNESKFAKIQARTDEEIWDKTLVDIHKDYKNEIYIFGHSLDITDKDIIKELIECPNTVTTIFYYDKGVYAQQIANMVKIIGQDELIERVSGANPTIIFKQQGKSINRTV